MKISYKNKTISKPIYSNDYFDIKSKERFRIIESDRHTAIIEGTILRIKETICNTMCSEDINKKLSALLAVSAANFSSHLEGIFTIVIHSKCDDSLRIYRSTPQSLDIYYDATSTHYLISDEITDLGTLNSKNNTALACILSEGYCPDKSTLYSSINRIACDEVIKLDKQNFTVEKLPLASLTINSDLQLEEYFQVYESAVLSRKSSASNWVEVSGGWDSTTVLGTLVHHKCNDVRAITTSIVLSNQQNFNQYEVEKAKQIAEFYDVPITIAEFNLSDPSLVESFQSNKEFMQKHQIYESQALWRPVMYQQVNRLAVSGSSCYNSLFADTIFNFGCSQYVTIMENSYVFREFVDKMATYLYGPTFVTKILNNSYQDDYIFNFFQWHNKTRTSDLLTTTDNDRVAKYLLSFIYGKLGKAVPFSKTAVNEYLTERAVKTFEEYLYSNYIEPLSKEMTSENIYFILLEIYKHFYLQGGEQKQPLYSLKNNILPASPFLDKTMLELAAKIPEAWGRGVSSWSRTKYPLKSYTDEVIRFPHDILADSKHHAYLHESENGKTINFNHELLYNSVYSETIFKNINALSIEEHFDSEYFDIRKLQQLVADKDNTSPLKRRLFIYLAVNSND